MISKDWIKKLLIMLHKSMYVEENAYIDGYNMALDNVYELIDGIDDTEEDRLAVALMGYMLEYVPWYHIRNGELIPGSTSDTEALYKASDIREMIEKIGGLQE